MIQHVKRHKWHWVRNFWLFLLMVHPASAQALRTGTSKVDTASQLLIGVKIYEYSKDLGRLFSQWRDLGINAAFVSTSLARNSEFMNQARHHGIRVWIIFPVFFNPEELSKSPSLFAITGRGMRAEAEWVRFVCPSREEYRIRKTAELRQLVEECHPDGVSLDFIRSFVYWEKIAPHDVLNPVDFACFCPVCLEQWQAKSGIRIPEPEQSGNHASQWIVNNHLQEWTNWKCEVITSMVASLSRSARSADSRVKVNVHLVPWRSQDFNHALRTVAGQDISAISQHANVVSPMCYSHMVRQKPEWVHSVVEDMASQSRVKVVPSIQVKETYIPEKLSLSHFGSALREALRPPSAGAVFWNWAALEESPEKQGIVKAVLGGKQKVSLDQKITRPESQ
jgi:hypothetical protein